MLPRRVVGVLATTFVVFVVLAQPDAQSGVPSWSEPVNVGAPINSEFQENTPSISNDGLSLYFSSNRPCGNGDAVLDLNLWVARRSTLATPWQIACVSISVDGFIDSAPDPSPDSRWLYFASDRPGRWYPARYLGQPAQ